MTNKEKYEIRRRVIIRIESMSSTIGSSEEGLGGEAFNDYATAFADKFLASAMSRARRQLDKSEGK